MWVLLFTLAATTTYGSGMLIPKDTSVPPLAIKHQRVDIDIKDGVATARIEQVFRNSTRRDLEAVYVFPLPLNAAIGDFAMYINGKRMSGELVEKDKARKIYQDIVRRMKDPGLLEHMGGTLFRVSVYPVLKNADQKIEIEYSQTLPFESGLYSYVYPLKTDDKASRTLDDFTVSARISSRLPIKNIYSPSHKVGISRKGEHEAIIGFEEEQALLDKDFVLYYGVSNKDFGLNLLTHAVEGQDGYCMLMLSPRVVPDDESIMKKDVAFVLDTSGSMDGKKIQQARQALTYCIGKLNPDDRFNIIRFSTDVERFRDTMITANQEHRQAARAFVEDFDARGGTDIDSALAAAMQMEYLKDRPGIIAFLTDGRPTIGESDTDTIVRKVAEANSNKNVRVFVFGVGEQVNTHLLDKISGENGGMSQYVAPDEDIEVKLSSFSDKMSKPVLSNLAITVDKVKVRQRHPRNLPDLFGGDQITVLGRYKGHGHVAIHLTGQVNGEDREFVYEATFPKTTTENNFIPRLWATRRVGYLLDEIRLHGEESELKDEVLKLSKEFGIMTPYTSYLVLENDQAYKDHGIARNTHTDGGRRLAGRGGPATRPTRERQLAGGRGWAMGRRKNAAGTPVVTENAPAPSAPASTAVPMFGVTSAGDVADELSAAAPGAERKATKRSRVIRAETEAVHNYFRQTSGADAVTLSEAIRDYKESDKAEEASDAVRHVGDRLFLLVGDRWVDSRFKKGMKTIKVTFADDAYFELLEKRPALKPCMALGRKVTVVLDDGTAIVVE